METQNDKKLDFPEPPSLPLFMNFKIRPSLLIFLTASILVAIFHFTPSLFLGLTVSYLKTMPPSAMVLIGEPLICSELEAQIRTTSPLNRNKIYEELIALLKWPGAEFAVQANKYHTHRQIITYLKNDDIPTASGIYGAQKCLLDNLALYKENLDKTLSAIFKSDLLKTSSDSQMRLQLQSFIQSECPDQPLCAIPIKQEILRVQDFMQSRAYIAILPKTREPGYKGLFEIFDTLDEKDFSKPSSNSVITSQSLLSHLRTADTEMNELSQQEILKRISDPAYPQSKKDFLINYNTVLKSSPGMQTLVDTAKTDEVLKKGQEILKSYQSALPTSTGSLENWLRIVQQIQGPLEKGQKESLTQLLSEFILWSTKHLGPNANVLESLISVAKDKNRISYPIPATHLLLKDQKDTPLALRILMLEAPLNTKSQDLLLKALRSASTAQRIELLAKLDDGLRSLPGSILYEISEFITPEEFIQLQPIIQFKRDDYVLNWRRNIGRIKTPSAISSSRWRNYMITKDLSTESLLRKDWISNIVCSKDRLIQIEAFLRTVRDNYADNKSLINSYLRCYTKNGLAEQTYNLIAIFYEDPESRNQIIETIDNTKDLSPEKKKELHLRLKQTSETFKEDYSSE